MDVSPVATEGQGYTFSKNPNSNILLALIMLAFGILLGAGGYRMFVKPPPNTVETPIDTSKLPASLETLQNPVITQWLAGVRGKLIKKDSASFTIENNGSQLTIEINPNLTGFIGSATPSSKFRPIYQYKDIPLGSTLKGEISIQPQYTGGLTGKIGEHITGNAFEVVSTEQSQ